MDDFSIDLREKYGATTLTNGEVFEVGQAFFGWLSAVARIGHDSPGSTLDYTVDPKWETPAPFIMRDFVAWTSGRKHLAPGCEERLRGLIEAAELDLAASANWQRAHA